MARRRRYYGKKKSNEGVSYAAMFFFLFFSMAVLVVFVLMASDGNPDNYEAARLLKIILGVTGFMTLIMGVAAIGDIEPKTNYEKRMAKDEKR